MMYFGFAARASSSVRRRSVSFSVTETFSSTELFASLSATNAFVYARRHHHAPQMHRNEQDRILLGNVHHVRIERGRVRGEAFNPRRLPDCRLVTPRPASFPAPAQTPRCGRPSADSAWRRMKPACAA